MTSKHYRWQTQWATDVVARTATHSSGLVYDWALSVRRVQAPDAFCCGPKGQAWVGTIRGGLAGVAAFLQAHPALRDQASRDNRLRRLAREAGEIYADALKAQTREAA